MAAARRRRQRQRRRCPGRADLRFEGYELATAYGGHEVIVVALGRRPHIRLMDTSMPECNGFDAFMALRRDARTQHNAIIAHDAFNALDEAEVRRLTLQEFEASCQEGQPQTRLIAQIEPLRSV